MTHNPIRRTPALALLAGSLLLAAGHAHAQYTYRVVAAEGLPVPVIGGDAVFVQLIAGPINADGHVGYRGTFAGTGIDATNNLGIWAETDSGTELIARKGQPAPGTDEGVTYFELGIARLSPDGHIKFGANVAGPGVTSTNQQCFYALDLGSTPVLYARRGSQAPGFPPNSNFGFIDQATLNASGSIVFETNLFGSGAPSSSDRGLWSDRGGNGLELLVREGDPAPGFDPAVTIQNMRVPDINDLGDIAYLASLQGPGITSANDRAIYILRADGTTELAFQTGMPAPGFFPGVVFSNLSSTLGFTLNNNAQLAFSCEVAGPGVSAGNNDLVWAGTASTGFYSIAREGDASTALPSGNVFTLFGNVTIGEDDRVTFLSYFDGDQFLPHAICTSQFGSPPAGVAHVDMNAPGTAGVFTNLNPAHTNERGQIVFYATVDDAFNGVWTKLPFSGELVPLLVAGDVIDVNDDPKVADMRTVLRASVTPQGSAGQDGHNECINAAGQILISVDFTDGTSAIVVAEPPVPCLPDVNHDGAVTPADFSAWIAAFNAMAPECDQNADGACTPADFTGWLANYNAGC